MGIPSFFLSIIYFICLCFISSYAQIKNCQLGSTVNNGVAIGFPRKPGRANSVGEITFSVIFVDYNDAVASQSPQNVFNLISLTEAEKFLAQTSYSKLKVTFLPPNYTWLRMKQTSASYNIKRNTVTEAQLKAFFYEATNLADANGVDFSKSDVVLVFSNPDAKEVVFAPTVYASPGKGVTIQNKEFLNGILGGTEFLSSPTNWLKHEIGHVLGLPDLYSATSSIFGYTGDWSIMGNDNGKALEHLGWEKWLLGWINDLQVSCFSTGRKNVNLSPIGVVDTISLKIITVKLSETK